MANDSFWFERPGDEIRDEEYPEEDDFEDEVTDTVRCPECGAEVYEDAPQCPVCGTYITSNTNPWFGRPVWWILLGLAGVVAVTFVLLF